MAVKEETLQIKRHVEIAERKAIASERKAEAAWELVIMTRKKMKAREGTKKIF